MHDSKRRFSIRSFAILLISVILICALLFSVGCSGKDDPSETSQPNAQTQDNDPAQTQDNDPVDPPSENDPPEPEERNDSGEIFGRITEYSTYEKGALLSDSFYYSDAWFEGDPKERNDSLALLSMQLAAAAITNDSDGAGAKALSSLGFKEIGFVGFETESPDDCAYTWATKTIGEQKVVAIIFQSYALDSATKVKGWKQNFHVNDETASGEHAAFRKAAESVIDGIASLGGTDAKYWIMGQSRAGAIANLIAAKLPDTLEDASDHIYAYTFEAPATVDSAQAQSDTDQYAYIHNYVSSDDIVPYVPMWGMTRYGNHYEVKSEATELALATELQKIGSNAAEADFDTSEDAITLLVHYLEDRLASDEKGRADYSAIRRDTYLDKNEQLVTITYNYQETMEHLMAVIFSGELAEINVDNLAEDLSIFASSVYSLADALKGESTEEAITVSTNYFVSAKNLRQLINGLIPNGEISLTDTDVYALLRLAAPMMVDIEYEPEGDPRSDVSGYIYPTIDLAQSFPKYNLAHHFDTVIARLKTLAPQPQATSFDLSASQPKAGDATTLLPESFKDSIGSLHLSWISVTNAEWNVDEQSLQNDCVYYFTVKAEVIGHLVADTFKITIDGKDPIEVESEYTNGVCTVMIRWEYVIGTPENISFSFEAGHGATAPASISIKKGSMLKYLESPAFEEPVSDESGTFLFDRWETHEGIAWEEITAWEDQILSAHWIRLIDEVRVNFDIHAAGNVDQMISLPEGAGYRLSEYNVSDENYLFIEPEEFLETPGEYNINLFLAAIEGEALFAESTDEYGERIYAGTVIVNGEPSDDYYCDFYVENSIFSVYLTVVVE